MTYNDLHILNMNGKIWKDIRQTNFFDNIQNIFPLCNIFMEWLIQYLIIANMTIVQ